MSNPDQTHIDVSFEVFPAGSDIAMHKLRRCVGALERFSPRFVSVTFGADGSDRARTGRALETLRLASPDLGLAGHVTSLAGTRAETLAVARHYESLGARWCVALRGDGADGAGSAFSPVPDGFESAPEMITALRAETGLRIAVAGYPEPHPASRGKAADLAHLKRKVDAGADAILTQFFFDNDDFYRFVDDCRGAGIDAPIVPGIMPIKNFAQVSRFSARCGASIPDRLADRFEKAAACGAERELAMAVCAGQCDELRDQGVRALHFYTLNDPELTEQTCIALGLDPGNPVDGDGETAAVEARRLSA